MTADGPWVLLLDDGELDDVRGHLVELGVEFEDWSKADLPACPPHPRTLLVAAAPHAIAARLRREGRSVAGRAVWIAVATGSSRTQHAAIFSAGFDYLVRRPVHPQALRLLLRAALYRGSEHRQKRRLAVGYEMSYRIEGRRFEKALLVDLSPSGCRLLSRCRPSRGMQLDLRFPAALTGGEDLEHAAVVTRAVSAASGECFVGLRFLPFPPAARKPMLQLLNGLQSGPAVLPEAVPEPARPAAAPTVEEKRGGPRGAFAAEVPICGLDGHVLVARDLSLGGMRVDPHPALCLGATLRLAVGIGSDADPVEVEARVARDDGPGGAVFHFDWIEPGGEERLRALVASLPPIAVPAADPQQHGGAFLTSVVPKLLRRRS